MPQGSHVPISILFHAFQIDSLHISSRDRCFSYHLYHRYTKLWDIIINFKFRIFLQICHPQISNFHIYFHIYSTQELDSQVWDFPSHSILAQHIQDPFFLQFQHSSTKQIVSSHAHYILIAHLQWLTNKLENVCNKNQIHFLKKEIPFLVVWLNKKLVFLMGLQHCHIQDLFLPAILTFLSKTFC